MTPDPKTEALKPCPFCGDEATIYETDLGGWAIMCVDCWASSVIAHKTEITTDPRGYVIQKWNDRASNVGTDFAERLRKAVEERDVYRRDVVRLSEQSGALGHRAEKAEQQLAAVTAERDEAVKKQPINTSLRLFDLVRYMRAELHQEELITDEEYGQLCAGPMAMSPKGGSPSRQRLEDYDEIRAKLTAAESDRDALAKAVQLASDVFDTIRDVSEDLAVKVGCQQAIEQIEAALKGAK